MNRAAGHLLACFGALLFAVACGDLKTAEPTSGDGGASSSSSSGATSSSGGSSGTGTTSSSGTGSSSGNTLGGTTGPGVYGALPFGYCCTKDEDCRGRNCATIGSQKMCLDACRAPETCTGKGLPTGFTCDGSQANDGFCKPPGGFTCLAANTFITGSKATGACCSPTGDGQSGIECAGGHCDWYTEKGLDPPYFCTNHCEVPGDCGGGFKCQFQIGKCVPANEPFTCE